MFEQIAKSTLRIKCGQSSGSGFLYRDPKIVVTNFHVVGHHKNSQVFAVTENGQEIAADVLGTSHENQYDFAILRLNSEFENNTNVLQPKVLANVPRGTEVIFSGFPHGISDLLLHQAIVSGPAGDRGFYIDGSVNGGNSGGAIVEKESGEVIGIVTQRRFLGAVQLDQLRQQTSQLVAHCQQIANRGEVVIMGVKFGAFAQMLASGFLVIDELLKANANTGIGIGFRIEYVNAEYDRLGLP